MDTAEQKRQKDLERLRSFRPMDDDFMRCLFKDNIPLAELVLRIITGKPDLIIINCQTQKDMKRLAGARIRDRFYREKVRSGNPTGRQGGRPTQGKVPFQRDGY